MRKTGLKALFATLLSLSAIISGASAMEITLRPDLAQRLASLKWVYPMPSREFENDAVAPFPVWNGSKRNVVYLSGQIFSGDFKKFATWFEHCLSAEFLGPEAS